MDRGSGLGTTKVSVRMTRHALGERAADRAGAREIDERLAEAGLSVRSQDRQRAMPRDTTAELRDRRMDRRIQPPDVPRRPLSRRQRKERSKVKHAAQEQIATSTHAQVRKAITQPNAWRSLNDELSRHAGDVQQLPDHRLQQVQRIDRAIQTYERSNERSHVVYCNVEMPSFVNSSNLDGYVRNEFERGDTVEFDRFTGSVHCPHELERGQGVRTAVVEIETRRGMYLGDSVEGGNTYHLLPRGLQLRVKSVHEIEYEKPDGSTGRRIAVQLTDREETES